MTESLNPQPSPLSTPYTWLEVDQAATLTGMSDRHIRRLAGDTWLSENKARLLREPGAKPRWQIRSDADPRLAVLPSSTPAAPIADLSGYAKKLRDKALFKAAIIKRWMDALAAGDRLKLKESDITPRFLLQLEEEGIRGVSRRTLYNWKADLDRGGIEALIDKRAVKAQTTAAAKAGDPFLDRVSRYYLDDRKLSIRKCYNMALGAADEHGWSVVSYETAYRYLQSLDRALVIRKREGEEAFQNQVEPYIERDYASLRSNQMWNADHHIFDVMVKVGEIRDTRTGEVRPVYKRPWLTAWQDMRSRKIVGWKISIDSPSTGSIIETLGLAIRSCGLSVPETVYTDNGKDFDASSLTGLTKAARWERRRLHIEHDQQQLGGIYALLRISHIHCWPYHGQSKPIERFFGRLEADFGKTFDTYCGRNAIEKPERLAEQLHKAPTLDVFTAQFADWLTYAYNAAPHTGDAMDGFSPDQVWQANLGVVRPIREADLELHLQPRVGPVTMQQNGVTWQGIRYGAYEEKLYAYFGRKVYLRLRPEIASVSVWTEDDRPICVAKANEKISPLAVDQDKRSAIAEKKRMTKVLRQAQEFRGRIHEDLTDATNRHAMQRAAQARPMPQDPSLPPPTFAPIRSPLEGASELLERPELMPMKKAVGDDTPGPIAFSYQSQSQPAEEDAPAAGFFYHGGHNKETEES